MKNKLSKMPPKSSPSTASEAPRPSKDYAAQERRYKAEDALRTITRAEEIRRDRPLMADVKKCAREQMKTLHSVTTNGKKR